MKNNLKDKFDVIIIGSGMGGMAAASILASQFGKKVLVIEKHYTFGGLTHEFARFNCSFDVGLHYLGELEDNKFTRQVFDAITGYQIKLNKMPDNYDNLITSDYKFSIPSSIEDYQLHLINDFPEEAQSIKLYFKDIIHYSSLRNFIIVRGFLPKLLRYIADGIEILLCKIRKIDKYITTQEYLDKHFKSEKLKSVLAFQWGDYGVPPKNSSMLMHSIIVFHYLSGGYYPQGGAKKIGDAVKTIIKQNGGEIILNNAVSKILIDKGKVIGVETEKNTMLGSNKLYADFIISNIGVDLTYTKLLPASGINLEPGKMNVISCLGNNNGFLTLYVILKQSPVSMGFDGGNIWYFSQLDHNTNIVSVHDDKFPSLLYMSFPTLKCQDVSQHAMEIISIVPYSDFNQWKSNQWMNRGKDYDELKQRIIDKIINQVESLYPGLKEIMEHVELSTPLSVEHFTSRRLGNAYGLAFTPERIKNKWINPYTPVKNLYLSGQDVMTPGVVGAMMGGVYAAGLVVNKYSGFAKIAKVVKTINSSTFKDLTQSISYLTIKKIIDQTSNAYTVVFDNPGIEFYEAGQYINLCIEDCGKLHYRSYSLTSMPFEPGDISITIKREDNGFLSNYIKDKLTVGNKILFDGPFGSFVWQTNKNSTNHYLMISGGSGITPIYAHIKTILKYEPISKITLLFANKTLDQAIFRHDFDTLAAQYPERFKVIYFTSQESLPHTIYGRINQDYLAKYLASNSVDYVFICTPKNMNNSLKDIFKSLRFPDNRLHMETYTFGQFL